MALAAAPVLAADGVANQLEDTYRAGELSLDGFGTASVGQYTINHLSGDRIRDNTRLGGGLGLNYFFTRNIGLGAEAYTENNDGAFVDSASANLLLRLPLGQSGVAPYALGGGGYRFDYKATGFAQFGAGLEYRFCPHLGMFLDARAVLPGETKAYGLARLGVRYAF